MASLKEVRNRIASVNSTKQITSAMRMVAASKLRKAQQSIMQLRPYAESQAAIFEEIMRTLGSEIEHELTIDKGNDKVLILVFTSNRGLSGAYNANVIKQVSSLMESYRNTDGAKKIDLITIGNKGTEFFRKTNPSLTSHDDFYDTLAYDRVSKLTSEVIDMYMKGEYNRVVMVYHKFKNALVQYLQVEPVLPVAVASADGIEQKEPPVDYIFDPVAEEIYNDLLDQMLRTRVYKALLESWASEQGARMTAMQQATDNASELIKELKLSYNKARQAAITKEIVEIVSGAEALKNM